MSAAGGGAKVARGFARALLVGSLLLVLVVGIAGVLLQGRQFESDSVRLRIENTLQSVIGDQYEISVASSGIRLISATSVGLSGRDVVVTSRKSGRTLVTLEEVAVGLDPRSVFSGDLQFDRLVVAGGLADFRDTAENPQRQFAPSEQLTALAQTLNSTQVAFADGAIEAVELENISVLLPPLGMGADQQMSVTNGSLGLINGRLLLQAAGAMRGRSVSLNAEWRDSEGGGRQLSFGLGDIPVTWWSEPIGDQLLIDDTMTLRLDGRIPYDKALMVTEPFLKVQSGSADIAFRDHGYRIGSGLFNLRFQPAEQALIVETGQLPVDGVAHQISGSFSLADDADPTALETNPVDFDLTIERAAEGADGLSVSAVGLMMPTTNAVAVDRLNILRGDFAVSGTARAGLAHGVTLSLQAASGSASDVLSVWPTMVAPRGREWLSERLKSAQFNDVALSLSLSPERLVAVSDPKAAMSEGEFSASGSFRQARIRPMDSLPDIDGADGAFAIIGNRLNVNIERAKITVGDAGEIAVGQSFVTLPRLVGEERTFEHSALVSGQLSTLAKFATLAPINAFRDGSVDPASLSGSGKLNIDLIGPLRRGEGKVDWSLEGEVSGFGSDKPVDGRSISDGDLMVTANRQAWTATGSARIDGLPTQLTITEPIEGSADLAKRDIRISTDSDQLAKRGISVDPVISGPLGVRITGEGRGSNRFEVDLTQARLSLPWIDWSKSSNSNAAAGMSFVLEEQNDVITLQDFRFSMDGGRKARGSITVDKAGLRSLDLTGVTLNEGDDVAISVQRNGDRLIINANGSRFDARPILQMIIHGDGLGSGGGTDVTLTSNFGRLSGFNGEVLETAIVRYETSGGRLQTLEVRGAVRGAAASILAYRQNSQTVFEFQADNAGASLALVDLYRKMEGGRLRAKLARSGDGPFSGDVAIRKFTIVGEERLSALTAAPAPDNRLQRAAGRLQEINTQRVRFDDLRSGLVKADGRLEVKGGWLRNQEIGLTFDGIVFDENEQMNLRGTFMPLFAISRALGGIPIIGDLLSNGRDSGLIGITYRLKGPSNDPQIAVNPLSIVAPGVFREIFQFRE